MPLSQAEEIELEELELAELEFQFSESQAPQAQDQSLFPGFTRTAQGLGDSVSSDPLQKLSDLTFRRTKGEQGLDQQIAQLRQQTGEGLDPAVSERQTPGLLSDIGSGLQVAANVGIGVLGDIAGGITGALATPVGLGKEGGALDFSFENQEIGVDIINASREFARSLNVGQDDPRVEEFTANLGRGVQVGEKAINMPLGGLSGLLELGTTFDPDRAADLARNIADKGFSKVLGESVLEETGSALLATIAETAPELAGGILGIRKIANKPRPDGSFQFQSETKKKIGELIKEKANDTSTAEFKLQDSIIRGADKVVKDKTAIETINQGFDPGVIAPLKMANEATRKKLAQMVNIAERGSKDQLFRNANRPSDVAGRSLMNRFDVNSAANRKAAADIDRVAKGLKKETIEKDGIVTGFVDDLANIDITFTPRGKLNLRESIISGTSAAEGIIERVVAKMKRTKLTNANEAHKFKRFLDEQLAQGETLKEGLTATTEGIVQRLRTSVDNALDSKFPDYNKANTTFSQTVRVMKEFQDLTGKKLNFLRESSSKQVGTLMRRVMGNAQSRSRVMDMMDDMDSVAKKQGKTFDDDLMMQTLFADELEIVFKAAPRTSLKGQTAKPVDIPPVTMTGLAVKGAQVVGKKLQGINEANAFKAIKKLLEEGKQ